MTPFELTLRLMSIPSTTGAEKALADFLASHLETLGYHVKRQRVAPDRENVIAFAGERADVLLCTHLDTVPPQLPCSESETHLFGRGACDTKGIMAAMIEAGERLRRRGITNFGLLLLVGEETDGIGAKTANQMDWHSSFVVVGEPTENRLARAQKGTLMANLSVRGKAAHSGYPEMGESAIEGLWRILSTCTGTHWGEDPVLGRGTFNIGVFRGGASANIVPAEAMASVMIRTVEPRFQAEERFRQAVGGRADIEIISGADPQFMHVVDGFETTVVSFGSDAPYLTRLGKPLLIGPGSIFDAHTATEKIGKADLLRGADNYERLVTCLLSD